MDLHIRPRALVPGLALLAAALAVGCTKGRDAQAPFVRLVPREVRVEPSTDASTLFDRDTTTALSVSGPMHITLVFPHDVVVENLKLFGPQNLIVGDNGFPSVKVSGDGWVSHARADTGTTREVHL